MRIIIKGRPVSKKNSKQVGRNKYSGKMFFTSSTPWKKFEKDAIDQLKHITEKYTGLIKVDYVLIQGPGVKQDFDNAVAGINDILQHKDLQIIDNDKNIVAGTHLVIRGYTEWLSIIEISKVHEERWSPDIKDYLKGGEVL